MNVFNDFKSEILKVLEDLQDEGLLPSGLDCAAIACTPPKEAVHGDISTNAALVLARSAGSSPRDLADLLAERLAAHSSVTEALVAGPGFINLRLDRKFWLGRLRDVLEAGIGYGDSELGQGRSVNVEFVSANPTGPLHVGHARGAVVGDGVAALLEKAGYAVTREYYINDAGAQVDQLARSVHRRALEALGGDIGPFPEGLYPGEYLKQVGSDLAAQEDMLLALEGPEEEWLPKVRAFAIAAMMELIKDDLKALGVAHDRFSSENALVDGGSVDEAFALLEEKGLIYTGTLAPPRGMKPDDWEERPQALFKSTQFGDDVDRPLRKLDGSWTYFATDIAYHLDKYRRGGTTMIDVWGADHGGYVKRMGAAVAALTEGEGVLDVKLCQLVNLLDSGAPVKMSKRAGTFVTLREVVDLVGKDVIRFIMVTRSNDAALDFDLKAVTEQTRDNPVFYVQYAHARACSVFRNAAQQFPGMELDGPALAKAGLDPLRAAEEIELIKLMAAWPRIVEGAALAHEPHRVATYLQDLAAAFHGLWNKGNSDADARFLVDDEAVTRARLALVRGLALVIASGLAVLGVEPVEEMR
ncbi:MAG: arginine--tRNA ligase [Alphaproteobacteria bacterium]|nr:arginine--tRNA ligase [Alphaproteobacteria bacterium]